MAANSDSDPPRKSHNVLDDPAIERMQYVSIALSIVCYPLCSDPAQRPACHLRSAKTSVRHTVVWTFEKLRTAGGLEKESIPCGCISFPPKTDTRVVMQVVTYNVEVAAKPLLEAHRVRMGQR